MRKRTDLTEARLRPIADQMNRAFSDALVTGYDDLIAGLQLPDPDDRHILAAAIIGRADVIVTFNEADFPTEYVGRFGIHTKHPDRFFREVDDIDQGAIAQAALRDLGHYKSPPILLDAYTDDMEKAGCPMVAAHLRKLRVLFEA